MKKNKIIYPKYACNIPTIFGESRAIFDNIFIHSKKVVLASATIPRTLRKKTLTKAYQHGFNVQPEIKITEVPFTYNVTMLKTDINIGPERLCQVIKGVGIDKINIFLVESTYTEADNLYTFLNNDIKLLGKVAFFEKKDFHRAKDIMDSKMRDKNNDCPITLTYIRSAICKAEDMPEVNLVIVDGSSFLPNIALDTEGDVDEIELAQLQSEELTQNLTQTIGRVFRSNEKRQEYTVQDSRNIVILIHNLPEIIQNFEPDPQILHSYKEYRNEEIIGVVHGKQVESIILSVNQALNGEIIDNKEKSQRDYAYQKGLEVGLTELGTKHRRDCYDLLTPEQRKALKELGRTRKKSDKTSYRGAKDEIR